MDWGRLFFSPDGRIRRQDFWMTFFILFGAGLLLSWFPPFWMVILYCCIVTRAKRLHDMGRTGWLQVAPAVAYTIALIISIYYAIGTVFTGINMTELNQPVAIGGIVLGALTLGFIWFTAILVDIGFLLWIGCTEGDAEDNRFGPPPVTPTASYVARA